MAVAAIFGEILMRRFPEFLLEGFCFCGETIFLRRGRQNKGRGEKIGMLRDVDEDEDKNSVKGD